MNDKLIAQRILLIIIAVENEMSKEVKMSEPFASASNLALDLLEEWKEELI